MVERLWRLTEWQALAENLMSGYRSATSGADRFAIVAAMVRHLLDNPALPRELLPDGYLADTLRAVYADFGDGFARRRSTLT